LVALRVLIAFVIAGFSGSVFAQENFTNEGRIVTEASSRALSLLAKRQCADLFGEGAIQTLGSADFRFVPMSKPRVQADGAVLVVTAATLREFKLILINRDGPFLQTAMSSNRIGGLGVDFRFGLKPVDYRALVLLHELGHLVGRFKPDGSDPELATEYTRLVRNRCF
jgi:hypothetical protein